MLWKKLNYWANIFLVTIYDSMINKRKITNDEHVIIKYECYYTKAWRNELHQ